MKKVVALRNLDCAHCAAKMEKAISKLDGVEEVSVSFMLQKLTIVADEGKIDGLLVQAAQICRRIEPDCEVVLK